MGRNALTEQKERPICKLCNINPVKNGGLTKNGFQKFQNHCNSCDKIIYIENKFKYRKHKKSICATCGFIPENKCQLDVDHIDGNHKNNDINNLQTLCSNCHRLKTYKQKSR